MVSFLEESSELLTHISRAVDLNVNWTHPHPIHWKTKKQEKQYKHNRHNNQKPNQ